MITMKDFAKRKGDNMSRFRWDDRTEVMCLLIYKILMEKNFQRGLRTKLCQEMAIKKDTPSYNSINLKVGNYEYLFTNGARGMYGGAKNRRTINIYMKFKDYSIKELKDVIKKLEREKRLVVRKGFFNRWRPHNLEREKRLVVRKGFFNRWRPHNTEEKTNIKEEVKIKKAYDKGWHERNAEVLKILKTIQPEIDALINKGSECLLYLQKIQADIDRLIRNLKEGQRLN